MGRWDDPTDDDIAKLLRNHQMIARLELTDTYDQLLLELKRLHNERGKVPENRKRVYDIAIQKIVDYMYFIANEAYIPTGSVYEDLTSTEKGGKYKKIYPIDYDIISSEDRKKKRVKQKPKRKVVKKCRCK